MIARHDAIGALRKAEIERLEALILSGTSVVLSAERGLGKTFVAARLAKRLKANGRDVAVLRGSRAVPSQFPLDLEEFRRNDHVLIVEDAHRLGLEELRLLVDAISDPTHTVLVTLNPRLGEGSASAESVQRRHLLTSLWTEMGLERIDLAGVGFAEALSIIEEASGRCAIDLATKAAIASRANGNPMQLRELTREELYRASRFGSSGRVLSLGPVMTSDRILDLANPLLATLAEDEEYALIVLAKLGSLNFSRASRLLGSRALRSLMRRGLVVQETRSADIISANYLFASAALASQEIDNRLEEAHTVEHLLLKDAWQGTPLSLPECVLVASYWIDNAQVDPADELPAAQAARVLALAARQANIWGHSQSAELFARRSLAMAPTVLATEQLSRCLAMQGDLVAAIHLLESSTAPHVDPIDDSELLSWWITCVAWQSDPAARLATLAEKVRGWGTVDEQLDDWLVLSEARERLVASGYTEGNDALEALAGNEGRPLPTRLRAVTELVPSYAFHGDPARLTQLIERGRELVAQLVSTMNLNQTGRNATSSFLAQVALFRSFTGLGRAGLQRDLEALALRAVETGDQFTLAAVNVVAGFDALVRNELARADVESTSALERIDRGSHPSWTVWVSLLRSQTLSSLGRNEEAAKHIREVLTLTGGSSPWTTFFTRHLEIRQKVIAGDGAGAKKTCLELAHGEASGSRLMTVQALHAALVFGEPAANLVPLLPAPSDSSDYETTAALEEHVRAAAASDAYRLDRAGARLAALDLRWQAELAFKTAQAIHEAHGRMADGAASAAQLRAIGADGTAPAPERMGKANGEDKLLQLTPRELEIARLAGTGLSNSEIAKRLFLSVRTVESHILQARVKLGVGRRSELGKYLVSNDSDRESA